MSGRLLVNVTYNSAKGCVGTAPELPAPLSALSLGGLQRQLEAALLSETTEIKLELDKRARLERDAKIGDVSIGYGKCTTSFGRSLRSTIAVPMPRTPPAFVRLTGSPPRFRNFSRFPIPKWAKFTGKTTTVIFWPPRQLEVGQQGMMMANPNAFADRFLAREAAAGIYLEEGVRRALEDNQRQIAEAEQREREREEREVAEARKAQEAEQAAYYAKHGWPT